MDDNYPPSQPRRGLLSGRYHDAESDDEFLNEPPSEGDAQPRRGLLSGRYHDAESDDQPLDAPRGESDTQPRRRLLSGRHSDAANEGEPARTSRPAQNSTQPRRGLLSGRYSGAVDEDEREEAPSPAASAAPQSPRPSFGGLLSRFAPPAGEPTEAPAGEPGEEPAEAAAQRQPRARDWRATDFATGDLDHWDRHGEAPFELPADPDAPSTSARLDTSERYSHNDRGFDDTGAYREEDEYDGESDYRDVYDPDSGGLRSSYTRDRDDTGAYRDDTGAYRDDTGAYRDDTGAYRDDTGAYRDDTGEYRDDYGRGRDDTGEYRDDRYRRGRDDTGEYEDSYGRGRDPQDSYEYARADDFRGGYAPRYDREPDYDEPFEPEPPRERRRARRSASPMSEMRNVVGDLRLALDHSALAEALNTIAQLGSANVSFSRVDRLRLLVQRRPLAAGLLAVFLVSFLVSCALPLISLTRVGAETQDLSRRLAHLQQLATGGVGQLMFSGQLSAAQADVAAIQNDLYELNGVVSVMGWPIGVVSAGARNNQALLRIGYDLAAAANDSMQVAQSVLIPLESGAVAANSTLPAITTADIQQAGVLLADADARTLDALLTYRQLDHGALPAQFQPGGQYGALLAQLPAAQKMLGELRSLVEVAPALLGVGQPAYYLIIAMNSAQLRPGGGVQSSYGVLRLVGGKQAKAAPFSLADTYRLDSVYAQKQGAATADCARAVTEPPDSAWWWPQRCVQTYGWGLRDANLSPDFPTNARAAMQIAQASGKIPSDASFQGVVAFTPDLMARLLTATGPMPMPEYNLTVTASNVAQELFTLQSNTPVVAGQDHEQFTRNLVADLLARIKTLQGPGLSAVFAAIGQAVQSKDVQVYLTNPRADLSLQQMGGTPPISASGDGFFVVDTNDGGNLANLYVSETQTDLVTLLPNGGAFHRLAISVTYDKRGNVTVPGAPFYEYSDMQRIYLPSAATDVGWSGFTPANLTPSACADTGRLYASIVTDCSQAHGIYGVTTYSDTPGRAMVMGPVLALCGATAQGAWSAFSPSADATACATHPQAHTQTIFISWTTPNAYTADASGHGTYHELIEKQPGDAPHLIVYITQGAASGPQVVTTLDAFTSLTANAHKVFDGTLAQNQTIAYTF